MDWSDSWRDAFRIELRAEAVGLAWRGWPVLPGTYPVDGAWTDGETTSADGPEPVDADWYQQSIVTDGRGGPERLAARWTGRPYSLLAATGRVLDAVEVPAAIGMRTASLLRTVGVLVPIAATPTGRWLFLTEPGHRATTSLAGHPDITLHGDGSWVPVPPSPYQHGIAHWRVKPQLCGWQLANAGIVQDAVGQVLEAAPADARDRLLATQRLSA